MPAPRRFLTLVTLLVAARGGTALAQSQPPAADSARRPAAPGTTVVSLSGLIFANYQYQLHERARDFNQFVVDRAYLTARATLGQGLSARDITDIFQSGSGDGWDIRLKYGYLQYDRSAGAWGSSTRAGMLQNVMIDHVEQFWPRFLAPTATDRAGFHSSRAR